MRIQPTRLAHKKLLGRMPPKRSLFLLTCRLRRKQLHQHQSLKPQNLLLQLPRHREHWVLIPTQLYLLLTGCTARGLGIVVPAMSRMPSLVELMLQHRTLANSQSCHRRQTLPMEDLRTLINRHRLLHNTITECSTCQHQLARKHHDRSLRSRRRLHECRSRPLRSITMVFPGPDRRDRRHHRHQALHPVHAIGPIAYPRKSQPLPFPRHPRLAEHPQSHHEPWIGDLHLQQESKIEEMRCKLGPLLRPQGRRSGTNGVGQVFQHQRKGRSLRSAM